MFLYTINEYTEFLLPLTHISAHTALPTHHTPSWQLGQSKPWLFLLPVTVQAHANLCRFIQVAPAVAQLAARSSQLSTRLDSLATHNSCVKRDNGGFSFNKATRQAFLPGTRSGTILPIQQQPPTGHGQHPCGATTFSGSGSRLASTLFSPVLAVFHCF